MVPIENTHDFVANIKSSSSLDILKWKSYQINTFGHFVGVPSF
jgi:hypothetical protein